MKSVRIWFKKYGAAKYISHLDMNRCMTRAVRRAEIPLWYTEGFNPHPYMTFLMPLPLGQEGMREPLDIRIEGEMSDAEVMQALNSVMPEGIAVVDVTEPQMKPNKIDAARYEIRADFDCPETAEAFAAACVPAVEAGGLMAEKTSKRGVKQVDLCEFVRSFKAGNEGETAVFEAVLDAGNVKNLNAQLLFDTLCAAFGAECEAFSIVRTALLTEELKDFK